MTTRAPCGRRPGQGDAGLLEFHLYLARIRALLASNELEQAAAESEAGLAPLKRAFLLESHYHAGWIHLARIQAALQLARHDRALSKQLTRHVAKLAARIKRQCAPRVGVIVEALIDTARGVWPGSSPGERVREAGFLGLGDSHG